MEEIKTIFSIDYALEALKILDENPYSALWRLTDDFIVNGHVISVKHSNQLMQVVIDGRYEHIGGNILIYRDNKKYEPLEYVRALICNEFN